MKGYLAKQGGIGWQKGFFDHRIRSDKLLRETLDYVRLNPVRAKLVEKSEDWPHQWPG
jgi:REP element-mobilizing transposase RayT